jgi:hypothetical protein
MTNALRRDINDIASAIGDETERSQQQFGACIAIRSAGKVSAESPRTRHGAEQAVQMARDRMQPHASAQLALDVWDERGCGFLRRGERRVLTK